MLKLKLQYFGQRIQKADSLGKSLMLGKMRVEGEDIPEPDVEPDIWNAKSSGP